MSLIDDSLAIMMKSGSGADITVESLSVNENGTYTAPSGTAYSPVTVSVSPNVGTKSITENGTYTASSDNLDGYSSVTVDTGVYVGTENPTSSLGKNGDYYYKRAHGMKSATTIGTGILPNQGSQYCGMIFSSATPITITGFRSFLKYNAGSVQYQLIDADTGTAVITTDTITYDKWDDWGNIVMLATPFTTTANKTYYVVANLGNPRGAYVSKSSASSDIVTISGSVSRNSIYVDWTVDNTTVYLVDILTETNYYTVTNQYYKETGSWVEIGT